MADTCSNDNKHLNSMEDREFFDWLSNYQLHKGPDACT